MKNTRILVGVITLLMTPIAFASKVFDPNTSGFVITGNPDGTHWNWTTPTSRDIGSVYQQLKVTTNNHIFISSESDDPDMNEDYYLISSQDGGVNWNTVYSVLYSPFATNFSPSGNGNSFVVADTQYIDYSLNGAPVVQSYNLFQFWPSYCNSVYVGSVASNNNIFALTATCQTDTTPQQGVFVSTDLVNWQWNTLSNIQGTTPGNAIRFEYNQWILLNQDNSNNAIILTSPDATTWQSHALPSNITSVTSVAMNNQEWIATGQTANGPVILHSLDGGKTWNDEVNFPATWAAFNRISYHDSTWVIGGKKTSGTNYIPSVLVSHDGITWQDVPLPYNLLFPGVNSAVSDIAWNNNQWMAIGTYEYSPVGCDFMSGNPWTGNLTSPNEGMQVEEFTFGYQNKKTIMKKISKNTYSVEGYLQYTDDQGGMLGFPIAGTCTDGADGSATFDLGVSGTDVDIQGTHQNLSDQTITITKSFLEEGCGTYNNFTGQLTPLNPSKSVHSISKVQHLFCNMRKNK